MIPALLLSASMSSFFDVPVIRIVDGDSIVVDLGEDLPELFRVMPVRLVGVDSAELKAKRLCERKAALKAKQELQNILGDGNVDLYFCTFEKYGRLLCEIRVDDILVSEHMLSSGFAQPYRGGKRAKWNCKK